MLSCTCPGYVRVRRWQEQAGLDPAEVAQWREDARQWHADPGLVKRQYVEMYEAAAAMAAGQSSPHCITFEGPPRKMMELAVFLLAVRFSEEEAVRLLGLTEAQVRAALWAMRGADRYPRLKRELDWIEVPVGAVASPAVTAARGDNAANRIPFPMLPISGGSR
jgi:hypothetical protein